MRIEWLYEAQCEFRDFLNYYKTNVGFKYAKQFSDKILGQIQQLALFPEMGVVKHDTLLGKYGFRALFIDQYVCIYKIEDDAVLVYHLADARKNYIYHIFGLESK